MKSCNIALKEWYPKQLKQCNYVLEDIVIVSLIEFNIFRIEE